MGLYFGEGHHGTLLGPDDTNTKKDILEESRKLMQGEGILNDSLLDGDEPAIGAQDVPKLEFDSPTEGEVSSNPSFDFIDLNLAEENVGVAKGFKIFGLTVGVAALAILSLTLYRYIKLNQQKTETLANYEMQMRIKDGELAVYADRYAEANNLISQLNDGTYGATPESLNAGKKLYSFADKFGVDEQNYRNVDLTEPLLDIYFDVSAYDLENVMGFTPRAKGGEDSFGRSFVHYDPPYEGLQAGIQGGEYYPRYQTFVLHVQSAVFDKGDGTVKAVAAPMPFLTAATNNGIGFDVTLTTYIPLAQYCASQGFEPAKSEGAPLGGKQTEATTYLTEGNVETLATMAIQDPNFGIVYLPNASSSGGKDLSSGGSPDPEVFSDGDYYVRITAKMKPIDGWWEIGDEAAFYQVGGKARDK